MFFQLLAELEEPLLSRLDKGGVVFLAGNGGSACDVEEFLGNEDNALLPLTALLSDGSYLSCVANDYGYEQVFARAVEVMDPHKDVLVALSTSGNSPNILRALEFAGSRGILSIAMGGQKESGGLVGGRSSTLPHTFPSVRHLAVAGAATNRIQELHHLVLATFAQYLGEVLPKQE
jgi:D-sedoheptulose 7-phosphate isomerase